MACFAATKTAIHSSFFFWWRIKQMLTDIRVKIHDSIWLAKIYTGAAFARSRLRVKWVKVLVSPLQLTVPYKSMLSSKTWMWDFIFTPMSLMEMRNIKGPSKLESTCWLCPVCGSGLAWVGGIGVGQYQKLEQSLARWYCFACHDQGFYQGLRGLWAVGFHTNEICRSHGGYQVIILW